MSRASLPWDIQSAHDALAASSNAQLAAENALREAVKTAAAAEEAYRCALAVKITHFRASGPATGAGDLARGDKEVAHLKYLRDVADGMREAAVQVGWRASADRKDAQALADWSCRREMAEGYAQQVGPVEPRTFGNRRAA